ncbi:TetR/AcrR family transcriptional regulator [Amycolatopsis sp. NPDC059657]|uniref:TetR/AcrR family transcriptional regulator n=1 Tax=Amycolatopsis sp. NPDC059657 TaxID=3346899 RepID=UPI0036703826
MVVFAGQGDAGHSMALLWRTTEPASRPGPKPGLSVEAIVAAGIAVADAEGMTGLSMRAVGDRLGRTAMALYTYVPNKGELIDLMYDTALAELPAHYDGEWRTAVLAWADDQWAFYLRHPWMLQVSQARPVLGPNGYVSLETLLSVLYRSGLSSPEVRRLAGALTQHVRGGAQSVAEAREAAKATGVTDEDWWIARSSLLHEVAPDFADRFPHVSRLETERDPVSLEEPETFWETELRKTFEFGLAALLDGASVSKGS